MTFSNKQDSTQSRRPLSVSINAGTFQKLVDISVAQGVTRREMLNRMLNHSIPITLGNQIKKGFKYKGAKGDKQINYMISSKAFNKLESFKATSEKSKARIVQTMIDNYQVSNEESKNKLRNSRTQKKLERLTWKTI